MSKESTNWLAATPQISVTGKRTLVVFAKALAKAADIAQIADLRGMFVEDASKYGENAQALIVCSHILADLCAQGWKIRVSGSKLWIRPPIPDPRSPLDEKDRLRRTHHYERDNQLREAPTREFICKLERQQLTDHGWVSIFSVMRDGQDLGKQLRAIVSITEEDKFKTEIKKCISPYLQFVSPGSKCQHTGLFLGDIWRYFRHTWSTPYNSTPGRQIWILVRDAAAPYHPVIGIAAVGSSVVQLGVRDRWIGWSFDEFLTAVQKDPSERVARWLHRSLRHFISQIYIRDLLSDSVIRPSELKSPTEDTIRRLLKEAVKARKQHQKFPNRDLHKGGNTPVDWKRQASLSLFRSKRSEMLASLLSVRLTFNRLGFRRSSRESLASFARTPDGRKAIQRILKHAKAEHVGIDMLDITVCGAVPPYNAILGGKLVSLLLTSPEIGHYYSEKYQNTASIIASSLAGRPIRRKPNLVLMNTTGLFSVAPSQYNRVVMDASEAGGKAGGKIKYERLGLTEGYGSYHLSAETVTEIDTLLAQSHSGTRVNSIFGEGVSPKLRKIRAAFDLLGLDSDSFLRHGSSRVVYGIQLATNFREILLGLESKPAYLIPRNRFRERSRGISDFWICRWLSNRIKNGDVLADVEKHTLIRPIRHGARVMLPETDGRLQSGNLFAESRQLFMA